MRASTPFGGGECRAPLLEGVEKKIVSKMAVFAETPRVLENSIQPLKIIVEFLSNRI